MARLMVCDECWELWGEPREIKCMGSGGPCCVCGEIKPCAGPISADERDELRWRHQRRWRQHVEQRLAAVEKVAHEPYDFSSLVLRLANLEGQQERPSSRPAYALPACAKCGRDVNGVQITMNGKTYCSARCGFDDAGGGYEPDPCEPEPEVRL